MHSMSQPRINIPVDCGIAALLGKKIRKFKKMGSEAG
jgi:hypothetical protein